MYRGVGEREEQTTKHVTTVTYQRLMEADNGQRPKILNVFSCASRSRTSALDTVHRDLMRTWERLFRRAGVNMT